MNSSIRGYSRLFSPHDVVMQSSCEWPKRLRDGVRRTLRTNNIWKLPSTAVTLVPFTAVLHRERWNNSDNRRFEPAQTLVSSS